ncbi:hypothetical protein B0H66DRAFT_606078 [Apodospora peruviana]|uniref:Uncharacterized protein n=1 Tax=Apodospora peruviana TaxID=516989 RepID=A0AAE0HYL3_9PEZI|nr:hypothetical protein B0H66DRAFT_606078 [Apodospora peruviana]
MAPTPSDGDKELFLAYVKYMKTKPEVDWDDIAQHMGYKNAGVAKVRFGQVTKRLGFTTPAGRPAAASPVTTGPIAGGHSAPAGQSVAAGYVDAGPVTPTKGVKRGRAPAATSTPKRAVRPKLESFLSSPTTPATNTPAEGTTPIHPAYAGTANAPAPGRTHPWRQDRAAGQEDDDGLVYLEEGAASHGVGYTSMFGGGGHATGRDGNM